jgi:hypothetical protein
LIKKAPLIMKKIKIMLTAVTVFAVVGGALAFKANNFTKRTYYTTTASGANTNSVCNVAVQATVTTGTSLTTLATTQNGGNCANIAITTDEGK